MGRGPGEEVGAMTDCASCKVLETKTKWLESEVERLEAEVKRLNEAVVTQRSWARSFYNQSQRLKKELEGALGG